MQTTEQVNAGTQSLETADQICRWLETTPDYAEVLAANLDHTMWFSMLFDLIGDTTHGLGRNYP